MLAALRAAGLATGLLTIRRRALQAGFDYMLTKNWGVNFDVKKIFLETKWTATHEALGDLSGKAKIDPWLIGAGVTYRF